jgi:hypothetical protein
MRQRLPQHTKLTLAPWRSKPAKLLVQLSTKYQLDKKVCNAALGYAHHNAAITQRHRKYLGCGRLLCPFTTC